METASDCRMHKRSRLGPGYQQVVALSIRQDKLNQFSMKYLFRTPVKELVFLSYMLGIYSFTKNEVIHRCSSKIFVAPSPGNFSDSYLQVGSFVKHLFPLCLIHPLILKCFRLPIQYFEDSIPPICK